MTRSRLWTRRTLSAFALLCLALEYLKWSDQCGPEHNLTVPFTRMGAMTDWTARVLDVPLSFLAAGRYQIETWADVADSEDPNQLMYQKRTVEAQEKFVLRLNGGGGQAARIQPVKK